MSNLIWNPAAEPPKMMGEYLVIGKSGSPAFRFYALAVYDPREPNLWKSRESRTLIPVVLWATLPPYPNDE